MPVTIEQLLDAYMLTYSEEEGTEVAAFMELMQEFAIEQGRTIPLWCSYCGKYNHAEEACPEAKD